MKKIDVGVFDEHEIFAYGVLAILRDDPMVDAIITDIADAASMDVAITSVSLIGNEAITCPIVACTTAGDVPPAPLTTSGVVALLDRDALSPDQLCSAVHAAAAGHRIHWDSPPGADALDERDRAVLQLLADGAGTREISVMLGYSERTIKGTIQHLQQALGARSRAHAVAVAMRAALI